MTDPRLRSSWDDNGTASHDAADAPRLFYPNCRAILQVVLEGFGADVRDSEIQVIPVLPKSATVHVNSYRQADSWEVVFDAQDLPFDPRLIRAGAIEIYIYQTSGIDDDRRVMSRSSPLSDPDPGALRTRSDVDTLALALKTPASRDKFTVGQKPRITGLFDDTDLEMSESGKWVTIKGQDYTAFLLAIQWPPMPDGTARRIPVGKRLDEILDDILADADPDEHLSLDVRGIAEADLPIVGANEVTNHARGIPVEQSTSYWDVMYKLAERHGFILFVDGLDVVLSRPKTITDKDTTQIRRMAWGRNLSHLSLKRHLGKEQVPTIVVKSYDPKTRKTLTAEYPNGTIDRSVILSTVHKGKRAGRNKVHGKVKQSTHISKRGKVKTTIRERDEYQIVTVYGITDPKALAKIAETRYHLLGKAERTVTMTTKDLRDLHGIDLLDASAGDAYTIEWDEFNRELMISDKVTEAEKVAHLVDRGFNTEVAVTIAKHYTILEGLGGSRPLRFKEGSIEFDVDNGIQIEAELMDFIIIDGIRPDSGAVPAGKLASRREALRDENGNTIGWTQTYEDAQQRRFRQ